MCFGYVLDTFWICFGYVWDVLDTFWKQNAEQNAWQNAGQNAEQIAHQNAQQHAEQNAEHSAEEDARQIAEHSAEQGAQEQTAEQDAEQHATDRGRRQTGVSPLNKLVVSRVFQDIPRQAAQGLPLGTQSEKPPGADPSTCQSMPRGVGGGASP